MNLSKLIALGLFTSVATVTLIASAAVKNTKGVVARVEVNDDDKLVIRLAGDPDLCNSSSTHHGTFNYVSDNWKGEAFKSIAIASLLSGKQVSLDAEEAGSDCVIQRLVLRDD